MPLTRRLLGFAFASADLLIELSSEGQITLALGAGEALTGAADRQIEGASLAGFVAPADQELVRMVLKGLEDGMRAGPVVVRLAPQADGAARAVNLSAFRLPDNGGAVSCALTRAAPPKAAGPDGLHDRRSFEDAATALFKHARTSGLEVELAMVEVPGFTEVTRQAGEPEGSALQARLAAVIRAESFAGATAAGLGGDRYALLREGGESPETISRRIGRLLDLDAGLGLEPVVRSVAMSADTAPEQLLKAIRYSVDEFVQNGAAGATPATLGEAFERSLARTLAQVTALGQRVEGGDFSLVYQPVVSLRGDLRLHHYEALIRFGDQGTPFPMIRMAEEMDLVCALDAAVVDRALDKLLAVPGLVLAVNISGRSMSKPAFVSHLRQRLKSSPGVRGRLIFELTESVAVGDLSEADRHIQALRAEGCEVCLDDFGAGASSLAYLQQLNVDVVKIDGSFIRELEHDTRGSAFIRQLVRMCGEMKVRTLAEMVETPLVEDVIRKAGVDMAQGWLYGAAAREPTPPAVPARAAAAAAPAARRRGAVESWG